ncbi:hypothetical protein E4P42_25685 [Mycobacterium sp. PS03-16]|uniref:DUF4097 family beta strand repeat-containing protein n=1 Tax=Mycobacterium sp. PS03-16 TaxID=2559611 RepID=UPI0010749AC0|nr:DUF4097 family beta strand repeat-containing protein [Mycobacterium sp. PS03-16]TFV54527.1 hypothetical protein E4P42_25685 [Mycobacterium sp. PS03-16]
MPTFPTPQPITVDIEVAAGAVHLVAGDTTETTVDVRPRDPSRDADVKAAEQTQIDFHQNRLSVRTPMPWIMLGRRGAVELSVTVPAGSRLTAAVASASVRADGRYAECRLSSASGAMSVEAVTGHVRADSASGDVTVHRVSGAVTVSTASGDAAVGELSGDLKFQTASGALSVDRLHGRLSAQSASGSVTVRTATTGAISVQTASGGLAVGIPEGTAAQLDLHTRSGVVTNTLQPAGGPSHGDETLAVRARTASGDISIHRAVQRPAVPR